MLSKDILNIVLAVSVFWVSIFLCWMLYYGAQILRQGYRVIREFNDKLKRIDDAVQAIRHKFEHSATYLGLAVEGIKEVTKFLVEKKRSSNIKRKKKKQEDEL